MENFTTMVSSRGLLLSCDSRNSAPESSSAVLDDDLVDHHRAGGTIYVCTHALPNFAIEFLPRLKDPFVLVSGDSDVSVNMALLSDQRIKLILKSNLLIGWFAQNLSVDHQKLYHLPIGLDYHTMWERPGVWGLSKISPLAQERMLLACFASSQEFGARYLNAYCNWHFSIERGDRKRCYTEADLSACFYESAPVTRNTTWQRQSEFMFVLSPEGGGIDCHRTWEALALGCVPIVRANTLLPLFAKLPVLVVQSWRDVTPGLLRDAAETLLTRQFDFSSLFLGHWLSRIRGGRLVGNEEMTMVEFRKLMTRGTG
jgi:hypothetical protein